MIKGISIKISNWSIEKIYTILYKYISVYLRLSMIPIVIIFEFFLIKTSFSAITIILALLLLLLSIVVILNALVIIKLPSIILKEKIDFMKYSNFLTKIYKEERYNKFENDNLFNLGQAIILLYKGKFKQSLMYVNRIDNSKSRKLYTKHYELNKQFIRGLAYAHTNDSRLQEVLFISRNNELQKIDKYKILLRLENIVKVLQGEATNYFDITEPQNHLTEIMYAYYGALNARHKGDESRAKELFESIAGENPDLFYVQEARKYLNSKANI